MTVILGLTGSIGMGKSTVAAQFKHRGVWVVDADALVHRLMLPKGAAFQSITLAFPEVVEHGQINRQKLGKIVFADDAKLKKLEHILHPRVRQKIGQTIRQAIYRRIPLLVLEIPLLYETKADRLCHHVAVVTAPPFIQQQRVLRRSGMTAEKLKQILKHQMPDPEKRRRADVVIHTGLGKAMSLQQVKTTLAAHRKHCW